MFDGDKIRELRLRENLSEAELGAKILVSQQAIAKWEKRRTIPNADNLKVIADFFGVPISYFYVKEALRHSPPQSQGNISG
jgi:transcriptional regulator with XRE-family HTH domain